MTSCERLAGEHERLVAADSRPVVVGRAAGVHEDDAALAAEEPRDVGDVDLLAEVVHVGEAALLALRAEATTIGVIVNTSLSSSG